MSEFDKYAKDYADMHATNVRASGYTPAFFDEYKVKEIARLLSSRGKQNNALHILNFGCGIGKSEQYLHTYFPYSTIVGADVSADSLNMAREHNKGIDCIRWELLSETEPIGFGDTFDVIFIANVFHHIPHSEHERILKDLRAHLRPGGSLFMFEHNPWNPLTVKTIKDCPFDVDAVLLSPSYSTSIYKKAGFSGTRLRFTLFFPSFARFLRPLEPLLSWLPLGAQYYCEAKP
ncbi:MAG: class I SAM-dependent methyltransferase [Ignavibacteria bacterium]|jgi:SAM-dependent methyltransferase